MRNRVLMIFALAGIFAAGRTDAQVLTGTLTGTAAVAGKAWIELLFDLLNALNDTAEERLADENRFSQTFAGPSVFVDPQRAMLGVRMSFQ